MWISTLKNKLLRMMGIKATEQSKLLWTFVLTFISGAVLCYISSLPIALFLSSYGSEQLPQIYLAVAFVSMGFGFAYAFLENRLTFKKLIIGLAFTLSLILTLLGTALIALSTPWIILILLIWVIMAYDLIEFCVWSIINRIYTMQQAKNSFGIIGGCQSIGGLTAGLIAPILVNWLGLKNLIMGTGFLALLMVFCMMVLINKTTVIEEEDEEEQQDDTDDQNVDAPSFKTIIHNKYILKIFALTAICIFAMYAVDLLFNTAAEARFPKEEELAGFLGVFFGLIDGVDLLVSVTIFGWLLKRLGIILTLFVLPTIGVILTLPITLLSNIPLLANIIFWLIVTLKLLEEGLRGSLTEMGNLLLLQPFQLKTRSYVQSKVDSIVLGFSTAFISIILIIISKTIGPSIWVLSLLGLVFFSLSVLILLTLKSDYIHAVGKAIASRFFERDKTLSLTKEDLVLLQRYLLSSHPDEVIYALNAIEQIDADEFSNSLNTVLESSNNVNVNQFIISKIKSHKLLNYYPVLLSFIADEKNEPVLIKALKSASDLNYDPIKAQVNALSTSSSLKLATAALIILLKQEHDPAIKLVAFNRVKEMSGAIDPKQRESAAYIISKAPEGLELELKKLCEDSDNNVRDEAYYAVLKLQQEKLYEDLIKNLKSVTIKTKFVSEFKKQINILQPLLEKHFVNLSYEAQVKSLKLITQIKDDVSKHFLEQCALSEDLRVRQIALNALTHFNKPLDADFLEALYKQINDETTYIKAQHHYLLSTPQVEVTELLTSVLNLKKQKAVTRLMLALSLYYDQKTMHKAQKGLKSLSEEEQGYAIELIDTLSESGHKKNITHLLIDVFLTEPKITPALNSEEFHQVLKDNLQYSENDSMSSLTCIACAYIVIKSAIKECTPEINALKRIDSPLIQETLDWLNTSTL